MNVSTLINGSYLNNCRKIYEISVEPEIYGREIQPPPTQRMQIVIPGKVDHPEIYLRSVNEKEFIIEWGEPRCYGAVKVKGYQLFLNDRKVGKRLSATHRKAVVPCKPNRYVADQHHIVCGLLKRSPCSKRLLLLLQTVQGVHVGYWS